MSQEVFYHEDLLGGLYLSSSKCKPALVLLSTFPLTLFFCLMKYTLDYPHLGDDEGG